MASADAFACATLVSANLAFNSGTSSLRISSRSKFSRSFIVRSKLMNAPVWVDRITCLLRRNNRRYPRLPKLSGMSPCSNCSSTGGKYPSVTSTSTGMFLRRAFFTFSSKATGGSLVRMYVRKRSFVLSQWCSSQGFTIPKGSNTKGVIKECVHMETLLGTHKLARVSATQTSSFSPPRSFSKSSIDAVAVTATPYFWQVACHPTNNSSCCFAVRPPV
mmetsp:Transcript_114728/g.221123  ORF Transcript_114728/g.221123 Transcript_114728/m.221123 type:complete len:218 (+) Transcript_114728:107-760(+)